jgi:energy-coupling factor transport system ATP-binding protein
MIDINALRFRSLEIDDLHLPMGITSIIGPNGSGKTTFLRLCAGIAEPESGTILIDGISPRQTEVGWVNEFPDKNILFPTVFDEIASTLRFAFAPCADGDRMVTATADLAGISYLLSRDMRKISGGEKVLVALAAALVHHPAVLVLDEYDSHLDMNCAARMETALRHSGATYIIRCTQQMETAANSDYLVYLGQGKVLHAGTPAEVFASLSGTAFYPFSWRCRI